MGLLKLLGEAFTIFAVSILILFVGVMLTEKRATGIGMAHWHGYVLMTVGPFYFAFELMSARLK
jgi:hypothetical protein